jgi:Glycosyl transferase family 2
MLSIVVNFYNNRREAANTLYSMTRRYQNGIGDREYEVIAIDNGSSQPIDESDVRAFGPEFSYRYVETTSVSPAAAINAACRDARGDELLVVIDGAHILSPGIFESAQQAYSQFASPFLATASFHLGPKQQNVSVGEGYDQKTEDRLLAQCGWKQNGYRLYTIAGSFADGGAGWFGCAFESGCIGLRKRDYLQLGGFDEAFTSRGGGMVNLDLYQRALARNDLEYVMLLGEGTFHQVHGGVASNAPKSEHPWQEFNAEYERLRDKKFARVPRRPFLLGHIPNEALSAAHLSATHGLDQWRKAVAAGEA